MTASAPTAHRRRPPPSTLSCGPCTTTAKLQLGLFRGNAIGMQQQAARLPRGEVGSQCQHRNYRRRCRAATAVRRRCCASPPGAAIEAPALQQRRRRTSRFGAGVRGRATASWAPRDRDTPYRAKPRKAAPARASARAQRIGSFAATSERCRRRYAWLRQRVATSTCQGRGSATSRSAARREGRAWRASANRRRGAEHAGIKARRPIAQAAGSARCAGGKQARHRQTGNGAPRVPRAEKSAPLHR